MAKLNEWEEFTSEDLRGEVADYVWSARHAVPGGWVYVYGNNTRTIDHAFHVPDPSAEHVAGPKVSAEGIEKIRSVMANAEERRKDARTPSAREHWLGRAIAYRDALLALGEDVE